MTLRSQGTPRGISRLAMLFIARAVLGAVRRNLGKPNRLLKIRVARCAARIRTTLMLLLGIGFGHLSSAQETVRERIVTEERLHSHLPELAHALLDSIGPRLTGSPANRGAGDWLIRTYQGWGIFTRSEVYGTWRAWTRGTSRVELISPRVRSLEAIVMPWSAGTPPGGIVGDVIAPPDSADSASFAAWVRQARGKFVLLSFPQPSCRPDSGWRASARPEALSRFRKGRGAAMTAWDRRFRVPGWNSQSMGASLEAAGVAGFLHSSWAGGWGVNRMLSGDSPPVTVRSAPMFEVSCEDYGLLGRLAASHDRPRIRAVANTYTQRREVPVSNTMATLPGTDLGREYVVLSAHLDSWDGGSGATDNGAGTIVVMEAMRLLALATPHPRRTIVAGHWNGEEQGRLGSGGFVADHADLVRGLQALFNIDFGTGRIQGSVTAGPFGGGPIALSRWIATLPSPFGDSLSVDSTTVLDDQPGSDESAFSLCAGAPAFALPQLDDWQYLPYTWHTARDTFDKLSVDDLEWNATVLALLAYAAAQDSNRISHVHVDTTSPSYRAFCLPVRSWSEAVRRGFQ
jgi:carboxypeptidase Q